MMGGDVTGQSTEKPAVRMNRKEPEHCRIRVLS
jgi:hypothetical protein